MTTVGNLNFPKGSQIEQALLRLLYEEGGVDCAMRSRDAYEALADELNLSSRLRTVTRAECLGHQGNNTPYWHTLVQATRERLVEAGHLHGAIVVGLWKLTEQGKRRAEELSLKAKVSA